jgi:predicted nucleic acid-binding protein
VTSRKRRLYWDSCNFISLVSEDEIARADICQHILEDAEAGSVEIVTSALTIAEVIKPKGSPMFTARKEEIISSFSYMNTFSSTMSQERLLKAQESYQGNMA